MALIDCIKFDCPVDDILVWKYPSENLTLGTQLIVNQSQEAIFVKGGKALDVFGPGTHTLSTGNLPFLQKLINLPFGGKTPFTAEVWFVNKTIKRGLKWGTKGPVQVLDPIYMYPVNLRAFGEWGLRVTLCQSDCRNATRSRQFQNRSIFCWRDFAKINRSTCKIRS